MKLSLLIISKEIEISMHRALSLINLLVNNGFIIRQDCKYGMELKLTEKAEELLSSNSPILYKENRCILSPYYAYCLQLLHLIRTSQ